MSPIEFFFDFSSPYACIASLQIEALAARHGRTVQFKPILLGPVFKAVGGAPLTEIPAKRDYALRDFARSARHAGVPLRMPEPFPRPTVNTARATLWLQDTQHPAATAFIHAAFRALFVDNRDINDPATLVELATPLGIDPQALLAAVQDPAIKDRLKNTVEAALQRGVFGAPFMFVDGEPFWGNDRLPQLEHWLAQGGF